MKNERMGQVSYYEPDSNSGNDRKRRFGLFKILDKSGVIFISFWLLTCGTGLVVLFWPTLREIYFHIIYLHSLAAMLSMVVITLCLPWIVRKRGKVEKAFFGLAVIFCAGALAVGFSAIFFVPYCATIWLFALWLLRYRELRALGVTLFFFQAAAFCGCIIVSGQPARFSLMTHGLWGILSLAGFLWLLQKKIQGSHLSRRRKIAGLTFAVVLVAALVAAWAGKNFKPPAEEYFYTQRSDPAADDPLRPAPSVLLQSAGCAAADCHPTEYRQWLASAHRFASNNRLFRRIVDLALEDGGKEGARDCVNCHDPVTTLSTAGLESWPEQEPGANQGINCQVCHLLRGGDFEKGNGYLKLAREYRYPYQDARPGTPEFQKFRGFVRLDPRPHINNLLPRSMLNQSKFCLPCHLVTVLCPVTQAKPLRLHLLFSQWENSAWKEEFSCLECHLPIFQIVSQKYFAMDHRFLGISTVHGQLALKLDPEDWPRLAEHVSYTKAYLAGTLDPKSAHLSAGSPNDILRKDFPVKAVPAKIFIGRSVSKQQGVIQYLQSGPILQVRLKSDPPQVTNSRLLTIQLETTNARVGHDVPSGPIDMVRCWCEVTCLDQAGRILFKTGGLDENGDVREGTIYLGSTALLDATGRQIFDHRFWRAAKVVGKQILPALASRVDEVKIPLPQEVEGAVSITAKWRYLRINQRLWNMAFDGPAPAQVPLDIGGAQIQVPVFSQ